MSSNIPRCEFNIFASLVNVTKLIQLNFYTRGFLTTKISPQPGSVELSSRLEGAICIFLFWLESEIQSRSHSQFRFLHAPLRHFQRKSGRHSFKNFFSGSSTSWPVRGNRYYFPNGISVELFQNYPLAGYGNIICKLNGYLPGLTAASICVCVFTAN